MEEGNVSELTITIKARKSSIGVGSSMRIEGTGTPFNIFEIQGIMIESLHHYQMKNAQGQTASTPEEKEFNKSLSPDA